VAGVEQAISLAIASSFWLGVGAVILAFFAALTIEELPLRDRHEAEAPVEAAEPREGRLRELPAAD
jgi:hypothetical protein